MLTPKDIENPKRKSGYDYVGVMGLHGGGSGTPKYQTQVMRGRSSSGDLRRVFIGPRRDTAKEAAQDYCDYVNGNSSDPSVAVRLNHVGHDRRDKVAVPDEVEAARGVLRDHRAQQKGKKGYVYCIGEVGEWYAVKVGYSLKPTARVGELQTGNPRPLVLLGVLRGTEATERDIHARHIQYNIVGEWFTPAPELLAEFGIKREGS